MIAFRDSLSHFWVAQTSQIYRELGVLEEKGWIKSTHIKQEGRPDKNMLSITDTGREELHKWLNEDVNKSIRSALLMKTFFRGECSIEDNIEYFNNIVENINVFPNGKAAAPDAVQKYMELIDDPMKALYWKFTLDYGMMYEEMLREWCKSCIKTLEEIRDGS